MFSNIGFAEIRVIETEIITWGKTLGASQISKVCIDNYLFVVSKGADDGMITQFYKERDGKSLPAKC